MKKMLLSFMVLMAAGALTLIAGEDHDQALAAVIKGEHRAEAHVVRDKYRHPHETLAFFGLKADMAVAEISPGRGYYTEILAPYLKDKGAYTAGIFISSRAYFLKKANEAFVEKFVDKADKYGNVKAIEFGVPLQPHLAVPNSLDMVLTFRNTHGWMRGGTAPGYFAAFYEALKPGGVLGVVQHRAKPGTEQDPKARDGYVTEAYVTKLAERAGFILVAKSEVNANPKDSADHPKGVWTLPPRLALEDQDKDKYSAIGESDRMTLKFVKP